MNFKLVLTGLAAACTLTGCGGGGGGADTKDETTTAAGLDDSATTAKLTKPNQITQVTQPFGTLIEGFEATSTNTSPTPTTTLGTTTPTSSTSSVMVPGWTYIPGAEFAGASGSLTALYESGNRLANLEVDVACGTSTVIISPSSGCGRYVGATRHFNAGFAIDDLSVARLNMKVRLTQPLIEPTLRLVDASGQTLQYKLQHATMESLAGDGWAQVSVPIRYPSSWWGGNNNGLLHGSINGMSVLASQINLAGPRSKLQIDEIRLVQDPTYAVSVNGSETILNTGVVPSLAGRLSVNALYYKVNDSAARLAAEAGFSVMRIDLFWQEVEQSGKFDFSEFDAVLKRLEQNGMKALFILDYGHTDHGGGSPISDQHRAAFIEYVKQATKFAQGRNVVGFEVWNEPDNSKYWKDGDPITYSQLLKATRDAVKSIDSTRLVLNGGPSWFNLPYLQTLLSTGNLANVDAFAIHGYRTKLGVPETFAADYKRLQYLLAAKGYSKPIWMTEWGHSTAGLPTDTYGGGHDIRARNWQARMVLRTILTQVAMNLPHINLYSLVDGGTDPSAEEENFGLLTAGMATKPAYNAVKLLTTQIKDKSYQGMVANLPAGVHGLRWRGSTKTTYVFWTESSLVKAKLSVPVGAQVTSWDGASMTTTAASSSLKTTTISGDNGPIYVTF